MSKSSVLERLYELDSIEGQEVDKNSINKLMYDLLHNKITPEEVESELRRIDPAYVRYDFLMNLKDKPIGKSIKEYKEGNLNDVQIAKMLSSLVTQIFIQIEKNDKISIQDLQIDYVLNVIQEYANSGSINYDEVDMLLDRYGWSDDDDT